MPLKLNIAMSRKVGEPNCGSREHTVGLEMEVDSSLVNQPQQLHERIARLFRLAKESIDQELNASAADGTRQPGPNGAAGAGQPRPATPAQVRAIHAIANRQNLNLGEELRKRFGVYRANELALDQASELIDVMKTTATAAASQQ